MKEPWGFIIVFSLMMTAILLSACTQLDKRNSQFKSWDVTMASTPAGDCRVEVFVRGEDTQEDDTIEVKHPAGG